MRLKSLAAGLVAVGVLMAQGAVATNSAVSGVVKDKVTGQPLANYTVSTWINASYIGDNMLQTQATRNVQATTDPRGDTSSSICRRASTALRRTTRSTSGPHPPGISRLPGWILRASTFW
jgi:hypothetical protein